MQLLSIHAFMSPRCRNIFATMFRIETKPLLARWATCAVIGCLFTGPVVAGDGLTPEPPLKAPNDGHCKALGEGFFQVSGSDACIRISGYVAAGADFGGGSSPAWRASPRFESSSAAVTRTGGGVSLDARFDTPMGPGRIYVDSGYNHFGP